jgi:hypothetical protein
VNPNLIENVIREAFSVRVVFTTAARGALWTGLFRRHRRRLLRGTLRCCALCRLKLVCNVNIVYGPQV